MASGPVSYHSGNSPPKDDENSATSEQTAQMEQAYAQMRRKMRMEQMDKSIKHKIMVLSGKGGVGKSTVSAGLALTLARRGMYVGIMDIDITGPNIPKMMGLEDAELHVEEGQIFPAIGPEGIKIISMAFLIEDPDKPVIWRGPIKLGAIQQFIGYVSWGSLDALIIDFPPGTSDEPLTVSQNLPGIDGVVIVTTPQEVALLDSRKSINFAKTVSLPVIGVVENMSGYSLSGTAPPESDLTIDGPGGMSIEVSTDGDGKWATVLDLFKSGGGQKAAEDLEVPYLGSIPFDPGIVRGGDDGVHRIVAEPDGVTAKSFVQVVDKVMDIVESGNRTAVNIR
jgi:ATP-binding protein involved in chromosome partitioning